ncbi:MAG: FecR domain-containing protein, partial [Marinoscillum sp.]
LQNDNTSLLVAEQMQAQTLQDGSIVTLNSQSELSYPEEFSDKDKREVSLTGEAFFEVERNPTKPFIIYTPTIQIEVLGTSFSVRSREEEKTSTVIVASGSVEVQGKNNTVVLKINEKAIFDKETGRLFKVVNDDPNYLSWKTKRFTFDDTPLHEVVKNLSNAHQTRIQLITKSIDNCPVTVSFDGQSLQAILEILSATLDLTIEKTTAGFEISGQGC